MRSLERDGGALELLNGRANVLRLMAWLLLLYVRPQDGGSDAWLILHESHRGLTSCLMWLW